MSIWAWLLPIFDRYRTPVKYTFLLKYLAFWLSFFLLTTMSLSVKAQYQSLMWKVSGKNSREPSYLYGTMHISSKLAFQLGDPFYNAIQSSDVVALELEPEAWLDALFNDPQLAAWLDSSQPEDEYYDEFVGESPLPQLSGYWKLGSGLSPDQRVREVLTYEPDILNYLMFRYADGNAMNDFEEDTWLDMHIYQTAKKMGRETFGLETYAESDEFIRKATAEDASQSADRQWDEGDVLEMQLLNEQLEPAYRRQDLDFIDSLTRTTTTEAFRKFILVERNKLFVRNLDSLVRAGKSVFAAMGCAHLPGDEGVIETLRRMGYEVTPMNKGSRNSKRRMEIERRISDCPFRTFTTPDGLISFNAPAQVYHANADNETSTWLCLDIANGANYSFTRLKSYSSIAGYIDSDLLALIDSMMYETVAGQIVDKKGVKIGRYSAIDVLSKTRRGDYERQLVVVMPEELLVFKLSAAGDKINDGYGDEFFEKIKINESSSTHQTWVSADGSVQIKLPSRGISYARVASVHSSPDFEVVASDAIRGAFYTVQRHVIEMPSFLDEDAYELQRCMRAFAHDRSLAVLNFRQTQHDGLPAMEAKFQWLPTSFGNLQDTVHALFIIQGLSYIALSTNEALEESRRNWYSSLGIANAKYPSFSSYTNSDLFFTTELPFGPIDIPPSIDAMMFNGDLEDNVDSPFGTNGTLLLRAPADPVMVQIDFQRFHQYSDGEDKESFLREKRELVRGIEMQILSERTVWTSTGADFEFVVADTATTRRFLHRMVLYNKAFYHLSTCYDSILGLSDFARVAFDSFHSTDTIFPYPHFASRDDAYMDDVTSADVSKRERALQITGEMDFSAASAVRVRTLLKELPYFTGDDAKFIRMKLLSALEADTSIENVKFLEKEFNAYPDSSAYQYELLRVLLKLKTRQAWQTYARLVVEEPPIVFDEMGGSGCETLLDSVKLAAPLLPKLMQLLAIDEYEETIYHLMALAADSGWLKPSVYKYLVDPLLVEARNELKRLKGKNESDYAFNTDVLLDFCALLHPFRGEKDVAAFFQKVYSVKQGSLLLDMVEFDWNKGVEPSDSIINRLSRMDAQVHNLYALLWKYGAANRMPVSLSSQSTLAEIYLKRIARELEEPIDSVIFVSQKTSLIRGVQLNVTYWKVRQTNSNQWLGHVLAFDARQTQNAWPLFIESSRNVVIDDDEDAIAELDNEYRYMEELNREFVNFGSGSTDFDVHWY